MEKTNVMRILDQKKIKYNSYSYIDTDAVSGMEVADALGEDPNYVFVVPVNRELNLKSAAKVVGEKSVEMIKSRDLLTLTGYIHGGCSPIGMKRQFKTIIDSSAQNFDTIIFSAGKIGYQVEVSLDDLKKVINYRLDNIVE